MSTPNNPCLQCLAPRETTKRNKWGCVTINHYGEAIEVWDNTAGRHGPTNNSPNTGFSPQFFEHYRRTPIGELDFIDCTHRGREHPTVNLNDEIDRGFPIHICPACYTDKTKQQHEFST